MKATIQRWTGRVLLAMLPLAPLLGAATPALAKEITVCPSGCAFTTIAAALNAADDGDTVQVGAGTYAGSLDIAKDVKLQGAGSDKTTILGNGNRSTIHVLGGADVTILNVAITGDAGNRPAGGGGIFNEGALTLVDSDVHDNAVSGRGGGILNQTGKQLKIMHSVIRANRAANGGGIYNANGELLLVDSTVAGNTAANAGGGFFTVVSNKSVSLRNSTVSDNRANGGVFGGGGIYTSGRLLLQSTTIKNNSAPRGGGISSFRGGERIQIVGGTIADNVADSGAGIFLSHAGATIQDTTISGNQARANGGGIFMGDLDDDGKLQLQNTTVTRNTANFGGGIALLATDVVLNASHVVDNRASTTGGGIIRQTGGSITLRNGSTVSGNQPNQCAPSTGC
jgi:predicted outer membrane repeat protein